MIRVLIIALLALGALALITSRLPVGETSDLTDGVWEGPLDTYAMSGERVATAHVRLEIETTAPGVRSARLVTRFPDGRTAESSGEIRTVSDGLRWTLLDQEGHETILVGRRQGAAVFWQDSDPVTGRVRTLREQVVRQADGDVYTVDGAGVFGGPDNRVVLYQGRYRRQAAGQ